MLSFPHSCSCWVGRWLAFAAALLAGAAGSGGLFCGGAVWGDEPARPNIVLFVTDDMSPDAGCYGNSAIRTPHLDALAKDGVRFTHAFCTTASCSASRSVILTGLHNHANAQYGHEHAFHHFRTYDHVLSLPARLAKAGYRTARVGKFHVGPASVYPFDEVLPGNARSPIEMADNCRHVIAADDERPFFLYYCTADPHRSGNRVESDPERPDAFGNQPRGYPGVDESAYLPADVLVPSFLPDTPTCRAELAQYYQSVTRADQGLGRLAAHLRAAGKYEQTVIIATSDHGLAFPGAKTTLYEGGMRIPFVVRAPRGPRGAECSALTTLADLAPTILDFAGVEVEAGALHGRSFRAAMHEERPAGWDEAYASHTFHEITMYYPMRVVRTRTHKLIWNLAHPLPFPFASDLWEAPTWQSIYRQGPDALYGRRSVRDYIQRPPFELYDLESDPHETHNLAASVDHAPLLAELKEKLRAFQQRTNDPWISKWDYE